MGRSKKIKEEPKRADGLYEVKMTVDKTFDGKLIRKSFYSTTSKDDARKQGQEYIIEHEIASRTGVAIIEKEITFGEWALKWLETYKKGKVKDNTYRGTYENPVKKHLIPHFGKAKIDSIKPIDIQNFFDKKAKTNAIETIKKMKECLCGIFETAIENDLCFKNPVTKNTKISSSVSNVKKRAYTQEQYDTVMKFAKKHPAGIDIMTLLKTGISRSELLGLKWDDIDFDNGIINVNQGTVEQKDTNTDKWTVVSAGLKNNYRQRPIPIDQELITLLKNKARVVYIGGNKAKKIDPIPVITRFVFYSPQGGVYSPKNWYRRVYKAFMEDMIAAHPDVPPLHPHELRHTCATLWKDNGVDLFSIAKLLGHCDLDMLAKRYGHNNVDTLKKALGL